MLLAHSHGDPALDQALELFLEIAQDCLGQRLVSVVLYGSIVFDDLAPGYGDLDFLAVVDGDLPLETCDQLLKARAPLRDGRHSVFAAMIEGAFLPRAMLDPDVEGRAVWWGTSSERVWERNELGPMVLHVICERRLVIWGDDIQVDIPPVSHADILEELRQWPISARRYAGSDDVHQVDWLLTAARLLLWLREGRLSSKSEAADWGFHSVGGRWREFLPRAKHLRLSPGEASLAETRAWLIGLAPHIREAADEVERQLTADMATRADGCEFMGERPGESGAG